MSKRITNEEELRAAVADADPLNKAWALELLRIGHKRRKAELEVWEEVLVDLTLELRSTMKKIAHGRELQQYDQFLIEQLRLLVLPNPDNPEANREKALAMFDMRPDGKQLPRPAIAHMKLGEPLDESTRKMFRQNLTRMSREAVDPASDFDRWHMRIMVVLLTAALEGRDVNTLTEATGYPRSFIEHVWQRAEQTGVDLNPLNWIADDGCTSVALWQDASVIEGRVELERYSDGTVALVDVPNSDEFVPHDFIAALRAGHKLRVCSRRGHLRSK